MAGADAFFSKLACYRRIHHSMGFKIFLFLLMFALDSVDLISDWLLYRDVSATEEGLVYGPPDDTITYSLLAFSVIGSITFVFEIVNLWFEIFRRNPWLNTDLVSAVTVWIEDVPQIIINVFIAACREEAISYFQLVKASVMIFSSIIRIILSLVRYCSRKAICELENANKNPTMRRHVVYRVLIMLGLITILGGSVTVFMFTQSERNPDGTLNFKIPHKIVEGEFDDQKYFQNVSVFFSHPLLDFKGDVTEENVNWLRLAAIQDIRKDNKDLMFKLTYQKTAQTKIAVSQSDAAGTLQVKECYTLDPAAKTLTFSTSCSSFFTAGTATSDFIFKFHNIKPKHPGLIFGDIEYNMAAKVGATGTCSTPTTTVYNVISDRLSTATSLSNAAIHYYRLHSDISGDYHVVKTAASSATFYHRDNMTDVTSVWRTGFAYCSSTGSLAPHHKTSLSVPCS